MNGEMRSEFGENVIGTNVRIKDLMEGQGKLRDLAKPSSKRRTRRPDRRDKPGRRARVAGFAPPAPFW